MKAAQEILWFRDKHLLNSSGRGGISITTDKVMIKRITCMMIIMMIMMVIITVVMIDHDNDVVKTFHHQVSGRSRLEVWGSRYLH